jgi:signal transduction histidine kinase
VSLSTAVSDGLTVQADPDLFRRVIENLIDNAIRHAPEGTIVSVTAAPTETGAVVRVADQGIGVPEAQRALVFERFAQAEVTGRANRGLGLSFCKLAVEAHGGQIWIEDAAPGAVFCVRLPDAH